RARAYGVAPLVVLSVALAPVAAANPASSAPVPPVAHAGGSVVASTLPRVGTQAAAVETHDVTTTGAVSVAEGFQTAAVTWPSEVDAGMPELRMRARAVDGSWGPWTHMDRAADGADSEAGEVVS